MSCIKLNNEKTYYNIFDSTNIRKGPTCVLKVHVVALQCIFQPVAHDFELHYLLPDDHVRLCDVKLYFWVVDLIGQAVTHHLWKISDWRGEGSGQLG